MAELVYILCAITSTVCAVLLWRTFRQQRTRLLMWSTCCFVGLAINNVLLFIDLVIVPDLDLSWVRNGTALGAVVLLLVGLLWEDA